MEADVRWDDDGNILDVRQADDVGGDTGRWCIIEHQAATSNDVIVSRCYPSCYLRTSLEELRQSMTKKIDRVEERAQQSHEALRDKLADAKLQARSEQAQVIRNIDQCLAETLALVTQELAERNSRMTREIERLLNDHDNTYAHTMTSLEKRLDAKAYLMMLKLDEILKGSNQENQCGPMEDSRQATDKSETHRHAYPPRSRTSLSLTIVRDPGQSRQGQVGRIRPCQKRITH